VRLAIVLTCLSALPILLFPGDTPWIFDEPAEITIALQANQGHRLASHALTGNFHIAYGPMPIQLNQLLLLISHDPRILILLRAAIVASIIAISLLWLGRTLNLPLYFAPVILLAPNVWLWTRQPWAAFLVTPLSILSIAAYAAFLETRCGWSLAITISATIAMPLIHPQSIPLSVILLAHILLFQRRVLWQHKLKILPPLLLLALLNYQYVKDILQTLSIPSALSQGHPGQTSRGIAFLGTFQSARLITPEAFESPLTQNPNLLLIIGHDFALIFLPLTVLGLMICLRTFIHTRSNPPSPDDPRRAHVSLASILLLVFFAHALFAAATRLPPSPHYQFGLFGPTILAVWFALYLFPRRYFIRPILICLYAASLSLFTLGTLIAVHLHGWPPNQHSPTLNEQIDLVEKLNHYSNESAYTTVAVYMMDPPHPLLTLRFLYPSFPMVEMREPCALLITQSATGRLQLIEIPPGANPPPNAKLIPLHYPQE
jgi:hypothetical protein